MKVDLHRDPPANINRIRKRFHRRMAVTFSAIMLGVAMGIYGAFFAEAQRETLFLNTAYVMFLLFGALFVFFTEKYHDYRFVNRARAMEVWNKSEGHPEIRDYLTKVAAGGRFPTAGECDAIMAVVAPDEP